MYEKSSHKRPNSKSKTPDATNRSANNKAERSIKTPHAKKSSKKRKKNLRVPSPWLAHLIETITFTWPLDRKQFWLSSPFGRRKNADGSIGFHAGVDLAAVKGTPVKSVASGTVKQASYHKGYGNMVLIAHANGLTTRYAHLKNIRVKVGQVVKPGAIIGTVGNTGHVRRKRGRDGSHLHFETSRSGTCFNPLELLNRV